MDDVFIFPSGLSTVVAVEMIYYYYCYYYYCVHNLIRTPVRLWS
jgi:hypothetical protein